MKKPTLLLAGSLIMFVLAGCATTDSKSTASSTETKSATTKSTATESAAKEEYVRYTPTGSWISRKVKKSDIAPTATETEETQRAFGELQRKGNKPERGPGG